MDTAAQPAFYTFKTARKGPRFPSGAVPQQRSTQGAQASFGRSSAAAQPRGLSEHRRKSGTSGGNLPPSARNIVTHNALKPPSGNPTEASTQGSQVSFGRSSAAAQPRGLSEHRRKPGTPGRQPPAKRPLAPGGNPIEGSMQRGPVWFRRSSAAAKPRGLSEH